MSEAWTIGQAADYLGLDADTLRYYERRGVVPAPGRNDRGHRSYSADDVHLLEVLMHLKDTGMPLAQISEFTRLVAQDPAGVVERLQLLRLHRQRVRAHLDAWNRSLAIIDGKISDYCRRVNDPAMD